MDVRGEGASLLSRKSATSLIEFRRWIVIKHNK